MGILSWIIFGLIAGILAKWIMPGEDGGWIYHDHHLGYYWCIGRGLYQHFLWNGKS